MPITDLVGISKDYIFKTLSIEQVSTYSYMSIGFTQSDKSIVVLWDCMSSRPIYQKEVNTLNKLSLSPSRLVSEYNELMVKWN